MSNNDLISREALKNELKEAHINMEFTLDIATFTRLMNTIDNAPTVDAYTFNQVKELFDLNVQMADEIENLKRPQGEWLHPYTVDIACECSNCRMQMPITDYFNFCPNCGADMRGGAE